MHTRTFLALFAALLPVLVLSDLELKEENVPSECTTLCQPIVDLGLRCAVHNETIPQDVEDLLEKQCVCTNDSFDVRNRTAMCAWCIDHNSSDNDRKDNGRDIASIMSGCAFSSITAANQTTGNVTGPVTGGNATVTASSIQVTATEPTATGDLTTTISTGVPEQTGGGGAGGGGEGSGAGSTGLWNAGLVGGMLVGLMFGM